MEELKAGFNGSRGDSPQGRASSWNGIRPPAISSLIPLEFGFGAKACSAAQYNMTVEPDGSVIPCQSWFKEKLGNILKDPWPAIWNHPVASVSEKRHI